MEPFLRFGVFALVFCLLAGLELLVPRRDPNAPKATRWGINMGLIAINVVVQRLTIGAIAVVAAQWAAGNGWGLFALVDLPVAVRFVAGFLLLDLAVYAQHVATHHVPVLWRLHRVHHADLDLDVTSGLRFHPVEILLSALYKAVVVIALGIDPLTVLVFEVVLNASALFTHANIRLPARLDGLLRLVVCTPDMHRIHHSVEPAETNSNYGFFLSLWDRLFATWRQEPAAGQEGMTIGLAQWRNQAQLGLRALLWLPFRKD